MWDEPSERASRIVGEVLGPVDQGLLRFAVGTVVVDLDALHLPPCVVGQALRDGLFELVEAEDGPARDAQRPLDLDDDVEKENHVFIIKAQDVGEAKERITDYCRKLWEKELDRNPRNSFIVLKGQPYETDGIVPLEYCQLYRQESEADDK